VTQQESFIEVAADRMAEVLAEAVAEHATTFPLFDDDAGTLVRAMIDEGKLAPYSARANEAGIAGRLIGDLDAFPDAEMDVILDVRESLKDPLVRFRSALAEASTEFASASWEQDFAREVDDLYRRRVAPALLEVREGLEVLGAKQTLLRLAARKDTAVAAGATIAVAATAALGHVDLPEVIYGIATPAVVAAAASEATERGAAHRAGEANAFYFLYQAERELRAS
jgi:hypothetical protein